jgi:RNA polymerase sigma-70 factor (ECF subfamily)
VQDHWNISISDDLLVERSRQGDLKAFNLLIRKWERTIYNFIYRFVGQHEEAQDLCQETFVRVYERIGGLKDTGRFRGWLYTIAANLSRDRLKRGDMKYTVALETSPEAEKARPQSPDSPLATAAGPEAEVHKREVRQFIMTALQTIPEEQRLALVLRTYHGMTTAEIAELTGAPAGTIRSRIFHGLRKMQQALAEMGLTKEELGHGLQ